MPDVRLTERAQSLLLDLPSEIQERIKEDLRQARDRPERELNSLTGYNYYSLRTGEYRTLIDWDRNDDVLWVFAVGHRRNIYDRYLD